MRRPRRSLLVAGLALVAALAAFAAMKRPWTVPPAKDRLAAVGDTSALAAPLRRAFDPGADGDFFDPLPAPAPDDWLANHPEDGQSFDQFVASRPNKPDGRRKTLYFLPLGAFDKQRSPPLDKLRDFAAAFFATDVKVLEPVDVLKRNITTRTNPHTKNRQLLTDDLLAMLARELPADAYALLGITMEDLYPDPRWNYVFGQASLRERVGVYSFARYDPGFPDPPAGPADQATRTLILRRSCKVLAHETGHMFGIQHCVYYKCLMNGSNHLREADGRPVHLCPADLRKLQWGTGFDPAQRYRKLQAFAKEAGFDDEEKWLARRIAFVERR